MGPSKLRNRVFLGKCSKWNLNFKTCLKALCLGVSERTKWLAAQGTIYALRKRKWKRKSVKKKSKSLKSLKYMDEYFFPTNDFSLLESCQLYITANYKAHNCCKIEAVIQRYYVKNVLLKILKN